MIGNGICIVICIISLILTCIRIDWNPSKPKDSTKNKHYGCSQFCTAMMSVLLVIAILAVIGTVGYYMYRFLEYYDDWDECECDWSPRWGLFVQMANVVFLYLAGVLMMFSTPPRELNPYYYHSKRPAQKSRVMVKQQQQQPKHHQPTQNQQVQQQGQTIEAPPGYVKQPVYVNGVLQGYQYEYQQNQQGNSNNNQVNQNQREQEQQPLMNQGNRANYPRQQHVRQASASS